MGLGIQELTPGILYWSQGVSLSIVLRVVDSEGQTVVQAGFRRRRRHFIICFVFMGPLCLVPGLLAFAEGILCPRDVAEDITGTHRSTREPPDCLRFCTVTGHLGPACPSLCCSGTTFSSLVLSSHCFEGRLIFFFFKL